MHSVIVPIVPGRDVRPWDSLEGCEKHFDVESVSSRSGAVHTTFTRKKLAT
jgi:hypothetical protein